MKEFFTLLFFYKDVVLTPVPINIDSKCLDIVPKEPLTVLTAGAALDIEISRQVKGRLWFDDVDREFPRDTIVATLRRVQGDAVTATNRSSALGDKFFRLEVAPKEQFRKGDKFSAIRLCATKSIPNVKVIWRNASK